MIEKQDILCTLKRVRTYIGKNDNGDVVGISDKDSRKLLEAIPNKITDTMGIVADVNLLNAIVHKDYSACNPIQISVYEDKIYIWNDGEMPEGLDSTDKLFMKHSSKPYNPKLANVFFMSGMIEAWGRGFDKLKEACARYDGPLLEYNISKSGVMVLCKACDRYLKLLSGGKESGNLVSETKNETSFETSMKQVLKPKDYKKLEPIIEKLATQETISIQEVMELTKKSRTTAWRYMQRLIDCNAVEASGNTNNVSYKRLK